MSNAGTGKMTGVETEASLGSVCHLRSGLCLASLAAHNGGWKHRFGRQAACLQIPALPILLAV